MRDIFKVTIERFAVNVNSTRSARLQHCQRKPKKICRSATNASVDLTTAYLQVAAWRMSPLRKLASPICLLCRPCNAKQTELSLRIKDTASEHSSSIERMWSEDLDMIMLACYIRKRSTATADKVFQTGLLPLKSNAPYLKPYPALLINTLLTKMINTEADTLPSQAPVSAASFLP